MDVHIVQIRSCSHVIVFASRITIIACGRIYSEVRGIPEVWLTTLTSLKSKIQLAYEEIPRTIGLSAFGESAKGDAIASVSK